MEVNDTFFDELYAEMDEQLNLIADGSDNTQHLAQQSIPIVRSYLMQLKAWVSTNDFATTNDEVQFFKRVKPRFYSLLIYYHKVQQYELNRPSGSKKAQTKFLHREQTKLSNFFYKYKFLYQYIRLGADYLDSRFFVRGHVALFPGVELYGVDLDSSFTTGYDFLLAKMAANDLLQPYLENAFTEIQSSQPLNDASTAGQSLSWTASKAALIELLYGLQSSGVFNHGNVSLNEIALFLEQTFKIKLGNYYRVFQEIRIRKKSRTQFLDEMKEKLVQKMDYTDENPHVR
jgi:hypothetical protein